MFRSLNNATVSQILKKNINGDYHISRTHFLFFFQNPSSFSVQSSISSSSSSPSFAVPYLMNQCGLSEEKAISISKKYQFNEISSTRRPDSVLTLLETYGFTKPYLSKLISGCPRLLLANPHNTFKPKLDFLNSIGLSGLHLVKVLSSSPSILHTSLENQIIPSYTFLKTILHSHGEVIAALKRSSRVLDEDLRKRILPNIQILRDEGVPESHIKKILMQDPRVLLVDAVWFKEIVEEIKGMGFDPVQFKFLSAVRALASLNKSNRNAKLDVFRKCGWSEDDFLEAFKNNPQCINVSKKKIMGIMDFFVNQMGYSPSVMAEDPRVLSYCLERTIIPRFSVIRILVNKGLIKKPLKLRTVLSMAEKSFLKNYVIKYEQEVPGLLKAYEGQ